MSLDEQEHLRLALRGHSCWVVGCGLLGTALATEAWAAGMSALSIDCQAPADVQGDAAAASVLSEARARLEPEFIFCCAATHGGDAAVYRATYLNLPQALLAACPAARLIFCSSSSVYGGQGGELVAEGTLCRAASSSARLLLEAEQAVVSAGGIVARLVPLYGPGRCELLRRFVAGEPELPGADSRWLNYVHAQDAARALLCLASHAWAGTCPRLVNICAESFEKGAVYEALSALLGRARSGVRAPGGRRGLSDQRVSSALLRSLGWAPQREFLSWAESVDARMVTP